MLDAASAAECSHGARCILPSAPQILFCGFGSMERGVAIVNQVVQLVVRLAQGEENPSKLGYFWADNIMTCIVVGLVGRCDH